ncbi:MAG TPA: glutathione S-transferase family protein [Steroidobacteraceae bacterium]|jgi:glutathione S-transferase|nr:glutathione S-transferase family protein [Steroidobacteraceae bacterium]
MITLYTFGPYFGLPDASPFVMKGQMLLKLAKLEYQESTRGFPRAPKGKLPYIDDDGTVIADSTLMRLYFERKYSVDFDRGLSTRDRGVAWATEKMLEDHLYWVMVYWRWMKDDNFEKGPANFFKRAPALIRPLVKWTIRGKVRRNLHGHGISRHNEAEMTLMSDRAFEALSRVLGDGPYLMGGQVCGADATAFAFIAGALSPVFESPAHARARSLPNLVAYRDRLMAEFYPGFVK